MLAQEILESFAFDIWTDLTYTMGVSALEVISSIFYVLTISAYSSFVNDEAFINISLTFSSREYPSSYLVIPA
jgi:hypothetical protein